MRNRINNVGIVSAFCAVAAFAAVLTGCEPGGGGGGLLAAEVDWSSIGTQATVICLQGGFPVYGATVTINGNSVPPFIIGNIGSVPNVNVGDPVTLHFAYKDMDVSSTLAMPDKPTITTLAGSYLATDTIQIDWTLPAGTRDNIVVTVSSLYTNSSNGYTATLSSTATSHIIPANTPLPGKGLIPVIVEEMNSTTNLGSSVAAGSAYQVANQAELDIATQ